MSTHEKLDHEIKGWLCFFEETPSILNFQGMFCLVLVDFFHAQSKPTSMDQTTQRHDPGTRSEKNVSSGKLT